MTNRKKNLLLLSVLCLFFFVVTSCSSSTGSDKNAGYDNASAETEDSTGDSKTTDFAPTDLVNSTVILYKSDGGVRQKLIDLKSDGTFFFDNLSAFTTVKQEYSYTKGKANQARLTYIDSCYSKVLDHFQGRTKIYKDDYLIDEGDFNLVFTDETTGTYSGTYVISKGIDVLTKSTQFVTGSFTIYY